MRGGDLGSTPNPCGCNRSARLASHTLKVLPLPSLRLRAIPSLPMAKCAPECMRFLSESRVFSHGFGAVGADPGASDSVVEDSSDAYE